MVLQTKTMLGGHPLIIGRPWLATTEAFISCRSGDMYISYGNQLRNSLYILQQERSHRLMTKNGLMMKTIFSLSLLFQPLVKIFKSKIQWKILNHLQNMNMINFKKNPILNICHLGICIFILWKNLVALQLISFQGEH